MQREVYQKKMIYFANENPKTLHLTIHPTGE